MTHHLRAYLPYLAVLVVTIALFVYASDLAVVFGLAVAAWSLWPHRPA